MVPSDAGMYSCEGLSNYGKAETQGYLEVLRGKYSNFSTQLIIITFEKIILCIYILKFFLANLHTSKVLQQNFCTFLSKIYHMEKPLFKILLLSLGLIHMPPIGNSLKHGHE